MPREILLIEPDYKNKYPPIGLMKISSYHKMLGDRVRFFKGNVYDLIVEGKYNSCIKRLHALDKRHVWQKNEVIIKKYLRSKRKNDLANVVELYSNKRWVSQLEYILKFHAQKYLPRIYDRIYVTTLFTFYWPITIKTIKQASKLVKDNGEVKVGGVMASLLPSEIEAETGIRPMEGLLDKPGVLDPGNSVIVDELNLDYSILDEIEYQYPTGSAYFTFMTKGCTRKCKFCSVPILEPVYKEKVSAIDKFKEVAAVYGDQRNLLLMDNNVLASPKFPEIVAEIKKMGFGKGAKYIEPNQFDIAIRNLVNDNNEVAQLNKLDRLLRHFLKRRVRGKTKDWVDRVVLKYQLDKRSTMTKENAILAYGELKECFEKYRNKTPMDRYVDFNQGIDGRYVNEENMRLLSQINVRPLRIAFDHIGMSKQYINAVELAAKFGIRNLSNYLLYNFKDSPEDLYNRMKINIDLNRQFDLKIFSFPMKYIPLFGEEAKDRKYISPKWNRKFIRTIQAILNVSKGIVAPGGEFFEMAFGKNIEEFRELLYMPEFLIIQRNRLQEAGITDQWREAFYSLNSEELAEAKRIIEGNDFEDIQGKTANPNVYELLKYYALDSNDFTKADLWSSKLRSKINRLLRDDIFLNLTTTYDFEGKVPIAKAV